MSAAGANRVLNLNKESIFAVVRVRAVEFFEGKRGEAMVKIAPIGGEETIDIPMSDVVEVDATESAG